jgi:asparagine synthase (glutamine-hydrolysing)
VTSEDTAAFLPQLARAYDEPFGNSSAIAVYHCAKLAREAGVDTLLAGDGGDELFGGNTRYVTNERFEIYHRLPHWFRARCFEPLLFHLPLPDLRLVDKARKYARRATLPQPALLLVQPAHTLYPRAIFSDAFLRCRERRRAADAGRRPYRQWTRRACSTVCSPRSEARHHGQRSAQGQPRMCELAGCASAIRCSIGSSSNTAAAFPPT